MASRSPSLNLKCEWVNGGASIERLDLLRFYASIIQSCSSERSLQLLAMTEYNNEQSNNINGCMDGVARLVEGRIN